MSNAIKTVLSVLFLAGLVYGAFLYFVRPAEFRRLRGRLLILGYIYVASVLIGAVMQLMGWR
ncbi:MAG: hypothetical protein EPO16_02975 [Dehalococcoidia bacterium]|nr:MAG: hypothetical protein EPO16_02975 [Dehalococcoidia bacterium]